MNTPNTPRRTWIKSSSVSDGGAEYDIRPMGGNLYSLSGRSLDEKGGSVVRERVGQMIYNAIATHDNAGEGYDPDFHARLFYIENKELIEALYKYWGKREEV